ncbi:MAG: Gx transporter family protein [Lachnospiraceae bacterium]|nr:Gx transporter family protein [Lachnospiraceae bacterium]
MNIRRLTTNGLLLALAFVFSYIEWLLPEFLMIPGAKPGFANIVIVTALYCVGAGDALLINLVRIILVGFTFGNLTALLFGLAGGLFSFGVMTLLKKTDRFGIAGVSIAGGVCHNLGQLAAAVAVMRTTAVLYYLPYLILLGAAAGLVVGIISGLCIRALSARGNVNGREGNGSRK